MQEKLMELALYVAEKSRNDPRFGSTKLNKILFAADFAYYGAKGQSITGSKYIHIANGPAPEGMKIVLETLTSLQKANIETTEYFGYTQKRLVPLVGANTSIFTSEELTFVDEYIQHFLPFNGSQLSEWTHKLLPWLLTDYKEEIPYNCIFMLNDLPVERAALAWAENELNRLRIENGYAH